MKTIEEYYWLRGGSTLKMMILKIEESGASSERKGRPSIGGRFESSLGMLGLTASSCRSELVELAWVDLVHRSVQGVQRSEG
jgi:hypothetical protein